MKKSVKMKAVKEAETKPKPKAKSKPAPDLKQRIAELETKLAMKTIQVEILSEQVAELTSKKSKFNLSKLFKLWQ